MAVLDVTQQVVQFNGWRMIDYLSKIPHSEFCPKVCIYSTLAHV